MSLEDDLKRNRKIFELLTTPEDASYESPRVRQEPLPPPAYEETGRRAPKAFEYAPREAETFSLERGKTFNRETGMALSLSPPEGVDFPELSSGTTESRADPLGNLYRQLEIESRRSSQLSREEEF